MEVFAELGDRVESFVGETGAFGEGEVFKARNIGNDSFDCVVRDRGAAGEIENAEMIEEAGVGEFARDGKGACQTVVAA